MVGSVAWVALESLGLGNHFPGGEFGSVVKWTVVDRHLCLSGEVGKEPESKLVVPGDVLKPRVRGRGVVYVLAEIAREVYPALTVQVVLVRAGSDVLSGVLHARVGMPDLKRDPLVALERDLGENSYTVNLRNTQTEVGVPPSEARDVSQKALGQRLLFRYHRGWSGRRGGGGSRGLSLG